MVHHTSRFIIYKGQLHHILMKLMEVKICITSRLNYMAILFKSTGRNTSRPLGVTMTLYTNIKKQTQEKIELIFYSTLTFTVIFCCKKCQFVVLYDLL